ncbi:MAG: hypothetical protein U5L08_14510 [Xanthomonadales bacterium]|nr:hypothetical protein [Xanthomonadales bacterium]
MSTMRAEDLWFADSDSHFYETRDAFTRHVDPEYEHLAIRVTDGPNGTRSGSVTTGCTFLEPLYDHAPVPGSLREVLRNLSSGQITEDRLRGPVEPEFVDRSARIAWMDEHRVETAVVVPSLAGTVEQYMDHDPIQTGVNVHAFNRWLDEDWGFARDGRLVSTPMISLLDVDDAVEEIEWLRAGQRCVHLRPGPQGGRSPADPVFDPFWNPGRRSRDRGGAPHLRVGLQRTGVGSVERGGPPVIVEHFGVPVDLHLRGPADHGHDRRP